MSYHILIVTRPGPLGDSLEALLSALPHVRQVSQAHSADRALHLAAALQPQLVVVDFDFSDNQGWAVLDQLRLQAPEVRCLVLAGEVAQKNAIERPRADAVLLKGVQPAEVVMVVEALLQGEKGAEGNRDGS